MFLVWRWSPVATSIRRRPCLWLPSCSRHRWLALASIVTQDTRRQVARFCSLHLVFCQAPILAPEAHFFSRIGSSAGLSLLSRHLGHLGRSQRTRAERRRGNFRFEFSDKRCRPRACRCGRRSLFRSARNRRRPCNHCASFRCPHDATARGASDQLGGRRAAVVASCRGGLCRWSVRPAVAHMRSCRLRPACRHRRRFTSRHPAQRRCSAPILCTAHLHHGGTYGISSGRTRSGTIMTVPNPSIERTLDPTVASSSRREQC